MAFGSDRFCGKTDSLLIGNLHSLLDAIFWLMLLQFMTSHEYEAYIKEHVLLISCQAYEYILAKKYTEKSALSYNLIKVTTPL